MSEVHILRIISARLLDSGVTDTQLAKETDVNETIRTKILVGIYIRDGAGNLEVSSAMVGA